MNIRFTEILRLHRVEKLPKEQVAEKLSISRTTVYKALESHKTPKYQRESKGSILDTVLPDVHKLLKDTRKMPSTVIAERLGPVVDDLEGQDPRDPPDAYRGGSC